MYEVAIESPLTKARGMSRRFGNTVLLKREDMQPIFSFKLRGAYNKISRLSDADRKAGIVAASAGNHAQGVALACKKFGLEADIVMPETTPAIKVEAVREQGARITRHGDTYDQAYDYARKWCEENKKTFIHPYNDIDIIAGQGTIGMEIHNQCEGNLDAVFVPVGGGGLIAGIALWLKHHMPEVKIIGVEPADTPTLHAALAAGKPVELEKVGLFADGVAVKSIGAIPFEIVRDLVDEVILVTTDEICAAIKYVYDDVRALAEPAGAVSVAGMEKYIKENDVRANVLVPVISGANMNFNRLGHVVERYEIGANIESLFAVTIPEKAGSFKQFCRLLGRRAISEFNYRYADKNDAKVFVGVRFGDAHEEKKELMQKLTDNGYEVLDLSDNEMSKLHLRHLIGGHADVENERIYRFLFPERPGALLEFLESLRHNWNISLFHYRNHGAAYGRVLVGIQVPPDEVEQLHARFNEAGYRWEDENANPAYGIFLR